jgi:hypothetical protein
MNIGYDKIIDEIDIVIVNTTGARDHVTDIERGVYTMKESAKYIVSKLHREKSRSFQSKYFMEM